MISRSEIVAVNRGARQRDDSIYARETLVDEDTGYIFSDGDAQLCFTSDIGRLFRSCQREYGRCTSYVYRDNSDGTVSKLGWTFEKLRDYDDHGGYPRNRREEQYKQTAWVRLYRKYDGDTRFTEMELK